MQRQNLRTHLTGEEKKKLTQIARHHGTSITGLLRLLIENEYKKLPTEARTVENKPLKGFTPNPS